MTSGSTKSLRSSLLLCIALASSTSCRTVQLPPADEPVIAIALYTPQPLFCGQATELELTFLNGLHEGACLCPGNAPAWVVEADGFTHASEEAPAPLKPDAPPLCLEARSHKRLSVQFVPRRHTWQRIHLNWTLNQVRERCDESPLKRWPLEAVVEGSVICPP